MTPQEIDVLLGNLKDLGNNANIAVFAYGDESRNMVIKLPNEKGDSDVETASKLAKIFATVLSTAEQKDQRMYNIIRNAMASAILPHINGLSEEELTALALLRL